MSKQIDDLQALVAVYKFGFEKLRKVVDYTAYGGNEYLLLEGTKQMLVKDDGKWKFLDDSQPNPESE